MSDFRVIVAGGGIGGLEAAIALGSLGGPGVAPLLLTPQHDFTFRALEVGEPFGLGEPMRFELADVLADLDVPHVSDSVVRVDPGRRAVVTASGRTLEYEALVLALGATPFPVFAHGITFDRPADPEPFQELLADVEAGLARDVVFVVPDAHGWTLPAYDLALLLRGWSRREGLTVGVRIVTAEEAPLQAFGRAPVAAGRDVLDRADVGVVPGASPVVISDTALVARGGWLTADRIVSLPSVAGPRLPGVPCDSDGFVAVEDDGAVPGCPGVYAVGDGAAHPRKQGGLAAQQADVAARAVLRAAGISVPAVPTVPVLRGVLATSEGPLFLQSAGGYGIEGGESVASYRPLWDPPTKVATRWLGPHLAGLAARRTSAFAA